MQQQPAMKSHSYRRRPTNKPNRNGHNSERRSNYARGRGDAHNITDADGYNVSLGSKAYQRAVQMREKYLEMAKDAQIGGDRVAAENFYQHADHYGRVISAANESARERQSQTEGGEQRHPRRHGQGRDTSTEALATEATATDMAPVADTSEEPPIADEEPSSSSDV